MKNAVSSVSKLYTFDLLTYYAASFFLFVIDFKRLNITGSFHALQL